MFTVYKTVLKYLCGSVGELDLFFNPVCNSTVQNALTFIKENFELLRSCSMNLMFYLNGYVEFGGELRGSREMERKGWFLLIESNEHFAFS